MTSKTRSATRPTSLRAEEAGGVGPVEGREGAREGAGAEDTEAAVVVVTVTISVFVGDGWPVLSDV